MTKNRNIKKQLIAACLLLVFLFITVTKLVHSHESIASSKYSSQTEQVVKDADCSICDYHFTKDIDLSTASFQIETLTHNCASPTYYQSRTTSSIGLSYSDRGPPALA